MKTETEYLREKLQEARLLLARNNGLREADKRWIEGGLASGWTPTDEQLLHETTAFLATVKTYPQTEDLRDPFTDETKDGIFRNHRCGICEDGKYPCREGSPNRCGNPRARND